MGRGKKLGRCKGVCGVRGYREGRWNVYKNGNAYCWNCDTQIPLVDLVNGKQCPCCRFVVRMGKHKSGVVSFADNQIRNQRRVNTINV